MDRGAISANLLAITCVGAGLDGKPPFRHRFLILNRPGIIGDGRA